MKRQVYIFFGILLIVLIISCKKSKKQKFDSNFLREIKVSSNGYISDISIDSNDNLWFSNLTNSVIGKVNGDIVISKKGKGPGELMYPLRINFFNNRLFILEANINRISLFDKTGKFLNSYSIDYNPYDITKVKNNYLLSYRSGLATKNNYIDLYKLDVKSDITENYLTVEKVPPQDEAILYRAIIERINNKIVIGLGNPQMKIMLYKKDENKIKKEKEITRENNYNYMRPKNNPTERKLDYLSAISDIATDKINKLIFVAESKGSTNYIKKSKFFPKISVYNTEGKYLGFIQDKRIKNSFKNSNGIKLACNAKKRKLYLLIMRKNAEIYVYEY
ncbi:MAG: hypothetical protein FXF47_09975 [Candidatus Mcinerneyibacterium aminivorans]|uniref:6-bladed beta-propeller n=1 Tax=Candidatus Mcinerneyibacterium aminivorans TaxID=2703815 RepID=A0A5D0MGC0_9BACT|nr:MAG: hypothetical protein FXF47_09975 [Candidatus Mcinerneyibacterium aminivorans]